jgi:hypothetical protein
MRKMPNSELPPDRARAQQQREADFFRHLGRTLSPGQEESLREIEIQLRIIRSNKNALDLASLSAGERDLIKRQIEARSARVKSLRR